MGNSMGHSIKRLRAKVSNLSAEEVQIALSELKLLEGKLVARFNCYQGEDLTILPPDPSNKLKSA